MKIFLVGLPGSGKSTLGKQLASFLNIQFVDLDHEIENVAGRNVQTIFKELGEPEFRKLETNALKKWVDSNLDFIMATGGGTPCSPSNIELIKRSGQSIFLDVPVAEILRRIRKTELSERPLLGVGDAEELNVQLDNMHRNRLSYYNQANIAIKGRNISIKQLVKRIND